MIQFRWLPVGFVDESTVLVGEQNCVLQYKLHFVPTVNWDFLPEGAVVLQAGRDEDTQWHDVTITTT